MIRLFEEESHRADFKRRSDSEAVSATENWCGVLQEHGAEQCGITMKPAGRLDVRRYLKVTKDYFEVRDSYSQRALDIGSLKLQNQSVIAVEALNATVERMILCQGATRSELFPQVPNNPSRGDVLTVRIPKYQRPEVVHRSVWIVANEDGTQTVGSTYDWKNLHSEPTDSGREEVLGKLHRIVKGTVEVESHEAGLRPTMKDYEAVIGQHQHHRNIYVFNGLGSKGTLKAARLATLLVEQMEGEGPSKLSESYSRLLSDNAAVGSRHRPLTTSAQEAVEKVLQPGDSAIDATVGNGFDTTFLSRTVGESGLVIGFDVQETALHSTSRRLESEGLKNVELYHQGHETIGRTVAKSTVSAVMFNLGFLPRHDHSVITEPQTSTVAISAALGTLRPGGVMTVLTYRGHEGGAEEYAAVERLLLSESEAYDLQRIDSVPEKTTSPVLFIVQKRRTQDEESSKQIK